MTDANDANDNKDAQVSSDDWASALEEQAGSGDDTASAWAEAMAEQSQAETAGDSADDTAVETPVAEERADNSVFKPLEGAAGEAPPRELDMIMEIPVTLSVQLGQTRLTIRELLDLAKGSIVELDGLAGEPMDILINGYLIAQGEVVVVEDKYGIRITEIITPAERINKLNR